MAKQGKLYGYKLLMAEIEDKMWTVIVPINFDYHWRVVV